MSTLQSIKPFSHPRLYFADEDIPRLRERVKTTHAKYWENLRQCVEKHIYWKPVTDVSDEYFFTGNREVYLEEVGAMLTNVALAYVISENSTYLELAHSWLQEACQLPEKRLNNYAFGFYVMGLARAYDWLYSVLAEEERQQIRDQIAKITSILYQFFFSESGKHTWWEDNYLHHDAWIPVAGCGVGSLVLLGEVDKVSTWAVECRKYFDIAFSLLGDNGAWHEGPADWCYAMAALLMFLDPWQRATDENVYDIPWIKKTGRYRLYAWLPDDTYIYCNDSLRSGRYNTSGSASSHLLRKLASVYHNGHLQWLADKDEAFDLKPGPKGVLQAPYYSPWWNKKSEYPHPDIHCAAWNLLWYDPTVEPTPPTDLPLDFYDKNLGIVFLRSGWGKNANITSFSCGPLAGHKFAENLKQGKSLSESNYGHVHTQYNAFTLFASGEYFIIPPGYGLRDARFQNTVLVDGEGLRREGECEPIIRRFDSQDRYTYILGDATDAFYPELGVSRFYRHFIFLRPNVWVIYDNLSVKSLPRRGTNLYEWRIHTDPNVHQVKIEGDEIRIGQIDAPEHLILHLKVLEPQVVSEYPPEAPRFVLEENPILLTSGGRILNRTIVSMYGGPAEWHNFAVIVYGNSWDSPPLDADMLEGDNLRGIVLRQTEGTSVVIFVTSNASEVSYVFHMLPKYHQAISKNSAHLICGLPPKENFNIKLSPVPELGQLYFRVHVVLRGPYQSSSAGVLYFTLACPSGI